MGAIRNTLSLKFELRIAHCVLYIFRIKQLTYLELKEKNIYFSFINVKKKKFL